jgi:hypothetical protein
LAHCQKCGADYRAASRHQAPVADDQERLIHRELLDAVNAGLNGEARYNLGFFAVLHQLCKVLGSGANGGKLFRWVEAQLDVTLFAPAPPRRTTFESRRLQERHTLVTFALWLLCDLAKRLPKAWYEKAVRFNHLLKDLDQPPRWYADVCTALKRPMCLARKS